MKKEPIRVLMVCQGIFNILQPQPICEHHTDWLFFYLHMKTIRPSSPACYINHILLLGATKNITCGDNLYVNAGMKFYLHDEAKIIIGNNVTFYSQNDDYHMNMFAGVKIIADRPGAVTEICGNTRVNGSCIHAWDSVKIGKKLSYCC